MEEENCSGMKKMSTSKSYFYEAKQISLLMDILYNSHPLNVWRVNVYHCDSTVVYKKTAKNTFELTHYRE